MCPLWKHEDLTPMMINGFEYELFFMRFKVQIKNGTAQNYNEISIRCIKHYFGKLPRDELNLWTLYS